MCARAGVVVGDGRSSPQCWSIASAVFMGTLFVQMALAPGYATWQDKTSTLLRAVGMGPALDHVETWLYTRSVPSDTPPDPRR
jgi:hypothetical protein